MRETQQIEVTFSSDPMTILAAVNWLRRHQLSRWERFVDQVLTCWLPPILFGVVVHAVFSAFLGPTDPASGFLAITAFIIWFDGMPRYSRHMFRRLTTVRGMEVPIHYSFGPKGFTIRRQYLETRVEWPAVSTVAVTRRGLFAAFGGDIAAIPVSAWTSDAQRSANVEQVLKWWHAATGRTA